MNIRPKVVYFPDGVSDEQIQEIENMIKMPTLIGLVGFAQSGKDEAAKVLVEDFNYTRVAFADGVRDALYALNPRVLVDPFTGHIDRVRDIVNRVGWDKAKQVPEVRELLQRMGTEAGRDIHGQNLWINLAKQKAGCSTRTVVTDVRFPNEAQATREGGGVLLGISRPGVKSVNDHVSDRGVAEIVCDENLDNDGDLVAWRKKVKDFARGTVLAVDRA